MVYGWWWYWGSQWSQAYYVLILGALLCPHAASKDVVPVPVIISLHNLLSTILIECRSQKQQWPDKSRLGQDETSFFLLLGSWLKGNIYIIPHAWSTMPNPSGWSGHPSSCSLGHAWLMVGTIYSIILELGLVGKYIFSSPSEEFN